MGSASVPDPDRTIAPAPRQGRPWWQWATAALLCTLVIAMAVGRAGHQRPGTDFFVFWTAGYAFGHGLPLYGPGVDNRPFVYPPFAAQVFQLFALFPLKIAAGLFYVASIGLWLAAVWLNRDIVRALRPGAPARTSSLVLAVVFSAQFVFNNLNLLQINLLTFVLSLLGIRGVLAGRPWAAAWLSIATWLKITPVFLLSWIAVRGGRRALTASVITSTACALLPLLQRGPAHGLADLVAYYHAWLAQFVAAGVVTTYTNQNLGALIYRALVPAEPGNIYHYDYLSALQPYAPLLYRGLVALVLAGFVGRLAWLVSRRLPITPLEIAGVFLTSHLISAITWKAHLVTMLFVFYAFLVVDPRALRPWRRRALWAAWCGIAVSGIVGRDLFGDPVHHYMGGYSVFVWVMLWLWGTSAILDVPGARAAPTSISA
jgi:hypothetical protein